eukprot:gene16342-17980_t
MSGAPWSDAWSRATTAATLAATTTSHLNTTLTKSSSGSRKSSRRRRFARLSSKQQQQQQHRVAMQSTSATQHQSTPAEIFSRSEFERPAATTVIPAYTVQAYCFHQSLPLSPSPDLPPPWWSTITAAATPAAATIATQTSPERRNMEEVPIALEVATRGTVEALQNQTRPCHIAAQRLATPPPVFSPSSSVNSNDDHFRPKPSSPPLRTSTPLPSSPPLLMNSSYDFKQLAREVFRLPEREYSVLHPKFNPANEFPPNCRYLLPNNLEPVAAATTTTSSTLLPSPPPPISPDRIEDDNERYSTRHFNDTPPAQVFSDTSLRESQEMDAAHILAVTKNVEKTENVQQFFKSVEQMNRMFIRLLKAVDFLIPPFTTVYECLSHFEFVPARATADWLLVLHLVGSFSSDVSRERLAIHQGRKTLARFVEITPLQVVYSFCNQPFAPANGSPHDSLCITCIRYLFF